MFPWGQSQVFRSTASVMNELSHSSRCRKTEDRSLTPTCRRGTPRGLGHGEIDAFGSEPEQTLMGSHQQNMDSKIRKELFVFVCSCDLFFFGWYVSVCERMSLETTLQCRAENLMEPLHTLQNPLSASLIASTDLASSVFAEVPFAGGCYGFLSFGKAMMIYLVGLSYTA